MTKYDLLAMAKHMDKVGYVDVAEALRDCYYKLNMLTVDLRKMRAHLEAMEEK
jgi:hypothetical protein